MAAALVKATARAVNRYEHSAELGVNVRSVIAYRAEQGDEWRGPWRSSMGAAQHDARARNRELETELRGVVDGVS